MKLIDKIKNAIFEEEEDELQEETIVKKIDVEKTTKEEHTVPTFEVHHEEKVKKPVIFSDEDFEMEEQREEVFVPEVKKEVSKPLYGGFGVRDEKPKDKFKPSPVLSPVYGILNKEDLEKQVKPSKSLESLFKEEKEPEVTFDTVRQKAYGELVEEKKEEEESKDDDLFFEMKHDDVPGVEKVTIGDAEEYYQDLGLEYNIDYKDTDKEKKTRREKNKNLSEIVDEEIKENKKIADEENKKKSNKKKDEDVVAEEKNLYDLIDMMYDSKE